MGDGCRHYYENTPADTVALCKDPAAYHFTRRFSEVTCEDCLIKAVVRYRALSHMAQTALDKLNGEG